VQTDMTPHMRSILVDWLVEVAMEYRLTSDTLHLTVALLDRFLSVAAVGRDQLQLAGIACMWAAAKYEEIYAPSARDFCFITDNTYTPQQVGGRPMGGGAGARRGRGRPGWLGPHAGLVLRILGMRLG
jgi:cyclin-A